MSEDKESKLEQLQCEKPCHPDSGCEHCSDYWSRMIGEGYWDEQARQWTEKGWREMVLKP